MFRTTCKVLFFFSILFVMVAIATNVGLAQTTSSPAVLGKTSSAGGSGADEKLAPIASPLRGELQPSDAATFVSVGPRRKVIMSLVVDRSGSMTSNGGATALRAAVPTFVSLFNNLFDEVALVSFANNGEVDFPIGYNFVTPITNAVGAMPFFGGTFGTGAGTRPILSPTAGAPMSLADLQNNSVVINPGQKVTKVMVYFTDGLMNAVQDNFNCPDQVLLNYGGFDIRGTHYGDIFDPNSKSTIFGTASSSGFPYDSQGDFCEDSRGIRVTTFTSQQDGSQKPLLQSNITSEAVYRAVYTANAMRTESPVSTYIYTIGLGTSLSPSTQAFLAQLANDPAYQTYIPGQPAGKFFYVPDCPSPACTADLNAAFQAIASKLLHG